MYKQLIVDPPGAPGLVRRPDIMMAILLAAIVAIYTALGGLRVSLITDLYQCGITIVLSIIVLIYLAVTFKYPLTPQRFSELNLGRGNVVG